MISIKPGSQQRMTNLHFRGEVSNEDYLLPSYFMFPVIIISVKWCLKWPVSNLTSKTANYILAGLPYCV